MATTPASLPSSSPPATTATPSCCQKIKSTLASRVVTIKRCMKECCSADGKTYALFILGRFLQTAAAAGMLASVACVFFFGAVTVLGSIPSAGLFALGHFLVKRNIPKSDSIIFSHPALNWLVPKTFVSGQPVGLINTSASHCWSNAAFQCVNHIPALHERASRIPELAQFINQYQQVQNTARSPSNLSGENLNAFLVGAMRLQETGQISADNRHADATAFFEWLFGQHPLYDLMRITTRPNQPVTFTPAREDMMRLQLTPNTPANVQALFNQFFDYTTEDGIRRQLRFNTLPQTIAINLLRYQAYMTNPGDPASWQRVYIQDPVEGLNALTLPQGASFSDTQVYYVCQAFIVHFGGFEGGHYIGYVKKDGKWWCCNDHRIAEVSEQEAMEQMKKSYLVFLNRG
jgi:hypothetical protein